MSGSEVSRSGKEKRGEEKRGEERLDYSGQSRVKRDSRASTILQFKCVGNSSVSQVGLHGGRFVDFSLCSWTDICLGNISRLFDQ